MSIHERTVKRDAVMELLRVHIRGVPALITNNGQKADPMNPLMREMKKLTGKGKKKTDDDLAEIARLEWLAGLYIGDDGGPCVPGECIEAMLKEAAKKTRQGKDAAIAIVSDGNWPILYDGPRNPDAMWESRRFYKACGAGLKNVRVWRTRPMFVKWELKFDVGFMSDVVNRDDVIQWLHTAGRLVGLCDWRPKHGRFEVVQVT